jgi:hypothetical protein
MQRYDFMSNHVSFSNRFWVSILDNPHRVYRLRRERSLSIGNETAEQFVNYKSQQLEEAMDEGNA